MQQETPKTHQPSAEQKIWMYRHTLLSRAYENTLQAIYMEGKTPVFAIAQSTIPGEMHLSQG